MNELRKIRKKLDITQLQAANACGVSLRTYQTYEETNKSNDTYDQLIQKLNEIGIINGSNYILSINYIKQVCRELFTKEYKEVTSAYLFGSYARGEASGKSDVDILVVCPAIGIKFFGISSDLEKAFHKKVDILTHRQLINNEKLIKEILNEGIKIYG